MSGADVRVGSYRYLLNQQTLNNPASGSVMQKAGMHYDATLKGYRVDKETGKRVD